MKKIQVLFITLSIAVLLTSCYRGRHTVIRTSDDTNTIRVEYSGRIVFSDDNSSIISMSPDSYFEFKKNNEQISAKSDGKGHIIYELNDGAKSTKLDEDSKRLMLEAVRQVAKAQGKKI